MTQSMTTKIHSREYLSQLKDFNATANQKNSFKNIPAPLMSTVNCPSQETEVTWTPTRPVENVITTKGLQDRNMHTLDGTTVENKGKLILTEIFPSVQKHDI